jgi:hypothetical protein
MANEDEQPQLQIMSSAEYAERFHTAEFNNVVVQIGFMRVRFQSLEAMVRSAIAHLLNPGDDGYGAIVTEKLPFKSLTRVTLNKRRCWSTCISPNFANRFTRCPFMLSSRSGVEYLQRLQRIYKPHFGGKNGCGNGPMGCNFFGAFERVLVNCGCTIRENLSHSQNKFWASIECSRRPKSATGCSPKCSRNPS